MQLLDDIGRLAVDLISYVIRYQTKSMLVPSEQQIKHLECSLRRMLTWCGFLAAGMLVLLAGVGLIIAGVYILLATAISSGLAALIVGVVVSLLAVILMVTVKSSMR